MTLQMLFALFLNLHLIWFKQLHQTPKNIMYLMQFQQTCSSVGYRSARSAFRKEHFGLEDGDFLVFWNNRNARRKQSGSLIYWFNDFLKKVKKKNKNARAKLLMHTDPKDPNGQDLNAIIHELGLDERRGSSFHAEGSTTKPCTNL